MPNTYYAGLVLTILGLIGLLSASGPIWARYVVLGTGILLLVIASIQSRGREH